MDDNIAAVSNNSSTAFVIKNRNLAIQSYELMHHPYLESIDLVIDPQHYPPGIPGPEVGQSFRLYVDLFLDSVFLSKDAYSTYIVMLNYLVSLSFFC